MLKIFNKRIMKLSKIKIQEKFKKNPPRWTKMLSKQLFYIYNRKFEQPIVVNKDNVLVDGYTTYLLAKQMGRKYMPVKRVSL